MAYFQGRTVSFWEGKCSISHLYNWLLGTNPHLVATLCWSFKFRDKFWENVALECSPPSAQPSNKLRLPTFELKKCPPGYETY